ncbi:MULTISPECIES: accessory Sec system protein translocase subunit SecY2 [unclassified Enterococcus]|uniref:accessory Sec system protein translocase subunit SecY2 n=1 Tax=unclassified Enterococcus TaxID=2608891 RepID=UPI001551830E|nr:MULTISPECIES: accessory Sec system protein translocase subunit SecY2 [unclassified Enterococcus]MBS7576333.1 accessory Sec system protein translocase subunit SecY2 [Enterococcus sp. MMGLQ5-2]MBS7583565.1 accessory Sec system protein translocase subunit SecY2 [Enterococcus sp. MMGLQ5-1]NPD11427.1 accessory Sec system protein translocase subunit SecY2 [Enterococcus sp. MMGLQ5-1]NPD36171.1 accessory Sec system protein translocase subunit SecY2 [Enterococcus sp. MMGLQ5-2]
MKNFKFLYRKIGWSLLLLLILELGKNIPIPGYTANAISEKSSNVLLNFISSTTGGNFSNPSLFSLGMGPYMSALIIWTTISMSDFDWIKNMSTKVRGYFQRGLTLLFTIIQAIILSVRFQKMSGFKSLAEFWTLSSTVQLVLILVAGGLIVSWLSDINCEQGIGGQSLFILPSILANIPSMLISGQVGEQKYSNLFLIILFIITIIYIIFTLFLYNTEYRIQIQRIGVTSRLTRSYLPIRILTAGAMPFMFAVTLFSIPSLLFLNKSWTNTTFSYLISRLFTFNTVEGIITYGIVIYLLALGFSYINFRPYDIAKNLRDTGDYIFNILPGRATESFLNKKLIAISFFGNTYLVLVSVIPLFLGLKYGMITNLSFYFGSIFMLIIIIDNLYQEIRFMLQIANYNIFNKI